MLLGQLCKNNAESYDLNYSSLFILPGLTSLFFSYDLSSPGSARQQSGTGGGIPVTPVVAAAPAAVPSATAAAPAAALQAIQIAPVIYGAGVIAAVGAFMAIPTVAPPVTNQGVPTGLPQPGTPLGGGPPIATSAVSISALSLVPPGLIPVAIFPPFAR